MSMKSGSLDNWRNYFRAANGDIFDIIDHAVMVAALDCPKEFKLRRDRIAEKLFTCKLTRCSGCDRVELAVPGSEFDEDEDGMIGCKRDECEFEGGGSKESKVNSSRDDHVNNQIVSNFSYGDAEALTDEIEEESQVVGEVLRIKEILHSSEDEVSIRSFIKVLMKILYVCLAFWLLIVVVLVNVCCSLILYCLNV